MRVRPLPEAEGFYGVFFHDWESGAAGVREMAQADLTLSMLRLSDAQETATTLALSGNTQLAAWAGRGLRLFGYGPGRCLLLFGVTGARRLAGQARDRAYAVARRHGGLAAGELAGEQWRKSRFLAPYLRNTLWEYGYALDTLETAAPWSAVLALAAAVREALQNADSDGGKRLLAFSHLSHVYRDGASLYTTYIFPRFADPDENLQRWLALKSAASRAILAQGGTISHQHGVGRDHAPYLEAEKGQLGVRALASFGRALDPEGMLNPGALYGDD
jgi:alkyldihydroxyacetonephosphate synthase